MKQKKPLWIVLGIVLLAALAVGMFFLYRQLSPKAQAGAKHLTVCIVDDTGSKTEYTVDTNAQYLLEVLQEMPELEIDGEKSAEYGYTLYAVNGVTADFTKDSAYWAVYVNGEYGLYNISDQPVADGESYTIAYETYQNS